MNCNLDELPDSGQNPLVYIEFSANSSIIGRVYIKLYRDVFPAGVENFVSIISGSTERIEKKGCGKYSHVKAIRRSYTDCNIFHHSYKNYIVSGDIYDNNGQTAGTIYDDKPIPAMFGDYYIPHDTCGLVSLVPFVDEKTGDVFYDSTFLITMDKPQSRNCLSELDKDHVVIGYVYRGLDVINKLNELIKPFAGRKYPQIKISACGVKKLGMTTRTRPNSKC